MKRKVLIITGALALLPTLASADYCRDCSQGWHHGHGDAHHHDADHKSWKKAQRKHAKEHRREHRREKRRASESSVVYAPVVHVEPVYRYYTEVVEDRSCLRRDRHRASHTNWTPAVLGAVIGGAVGHRIGDSHGDADAAAIAGGLLGAAIGRDVALNDRESRSVSVRGPCRTVERELRHREPLEYVVSYRYNGQVYRTHMDRHPGEWIELDVKIKPV